MARRIKSLNDVQRLLAWLINAVIDDKIDQSKAGKIGYLSNILRGVIADGDLEQRVDALEKDLNKKENQR